MARLHSEHTWRIDIAAVALLVGITLVVAVVPGWFLVARHRGTEQLRVDVAAQERLLKDLEGELDQAMADLAEVEEALTDRAVQLSPADAVNAKLASLSDLAAQLGLQIDQIRPGEPQPGLYYQTVPLEVAGVGTYRQCAMFLRQLKLTMPDTSAGSFNLAGSSGDPMQPGTFRFGLQWVAAVDTGPAPVAVP